MRWIFVWFPQCFYYIFCSCFTDDSEAEVDSSDDCESQTTSTVRSAFKVVPQIASFKEQGKSVTQAGNAGNKTNQLNQAFMKHEQSSDDCDCNACAKRRLYDASLKRFYDTSAKGATTNNTNNHVKDSHPDDKFQCQECGKGFDGFEKMWHHKGFHKQEKELIRSKSKENQIQISKKSIKQMQTKNFNSKIAPCDLCGRKLKSQSSLNRHMRVVHSIPKSNTTPMPVPPCDVCGKECKNLALLRKHKFSVHSTEKPWKCEDCGKTFRWKKDAVLCKHSSRKIEPDKHRCYVCGEDFLNKGCLRVHLRLVHDLPETQKFPCLICDEMFSQIQELRDHLPLHSVESNQSLKCKFCDRDFNDPSGLRKHLLRHKNKNHSCEICGKDAMNISSCRRHKKFHCQQIACHVCGRVMSSACKLKEHMNVHTGDKPIECDVCHKKLPSSSALKNHKTRMHNKNNGGNKCFICGKLFKTPFARNTHHFVKHTEEERRQHNVIVKMFTCHICGKTLRTEYKTSHLNKHKSKSEILHVCEICGKGFIRRSLLTEHMMEHKDEQGDLCLTEVKKEILETSLQFEKEYELKHACDICGKKFRFVSSLAYHKKVHNTDKPHRCDVCGKGFKFEHRLRQHERKHFGDEPFSCEICGKKFQRYILLQSHMSTHSSIKAFTCPTCGTGFKYQRNMIRHIALVHNRERRFTCDVCGKSFGTRSVLKIHYRKHTGEKPYTCDTCGNSFSDPSTLYKHKMLHKKMASNLVMVSDTDQPNVTHYILEGEHQTEIIVFS